MSAARWGAAAFALLLAGLPGTLLSGGQQGSQKQPGPVATVQTAPLKQGTITETITTYGTVIPSPGAVRVLSVPFETLVERVRVSAGQRVRAGETLVKIDLSPDTRLKLEMARTALEMARTRLDQVKQRRELKLATNQEVFQTEQAYREAKLQYDSLVNRGVEKIREIKAGDDGIIGKVFAREGALVAAGGAIVEAVAGGALEVRLGGEAEDVPHVRPGMSVKLSAVNRPLRTGVRGKVRAVSHSVNPSTRLVDIYVVPSTSSGLFLDEYVRGDIQVSTRRGLLAPRSAVLPKGDHHELFTVSNGIAKLHRVKIGLENEREVQVIAKELKSGDEIVVLGNYELRDGMAVRVEPKR